MHLWALTHSLHRQPGHVLAAGLPGPGAAVGLALVLAVCLRHLIDAPAIASTRFASPPGHIAHARSAPRHRQLRSSMRMRAQQYACCSRCVLVVHNTTIAREACAVLQAHAHNIIRDGRQLRHTWRGCSAGTGRAARPSRRRWSPSRRPCAVIDKWCPGGTWPGSPGSRPGM